jgi:hypothetical protein
MPVDVRNFTIATDTVNGKLNESALEAEIGATAAIQKALDGIARKGDGTFDVRFADTLGPTEVTALTGDTDPPSPGSVIWDHTGDPLIESFQFWELNPADTTTLETWQEVMSRTAAALLDGSYRLSWYFELKLTPTGPINSKAMARFLVDGNVKGNVQTVEDGFVAFSGWDRFSGADGDKPVLSLEIQRDPTLGGNDTVEIRKMKLGIELMR